MNFFANLFGYLLNYIYNLVNNYGLAIILFTIILKIIMLPVSIKQQKTLKKTTKIQAEAKIIQDKYSNDQLRQSQELIDLYKRENMSPFSGCLSSIIQFVIILSMFFLVSRPLTYMKHIDPELLNKYTQQLVEESNGQIRYTEIAIIKNMSDKDENVKINMNFLGLDLSDVPTQNYKDWKVFVIPVLYVITSIATTKITTSMNKKAKEESEKKHNVVPKEQIEENDSQKDLVVKKEEHKEDDAMEEMNKQMALMMPIMSVSIALIAPLGLALYWLASNLLNICERLIINKYFKEEGKDSNG